MRNKISNYYDAVHYLGNSFILLNNIREIDEDFFCDELIGEWFNEDDEMPEIYQFFLTDCSTEDASYLANRFNLLFAYSPLLDNWVLCVPHFGTMWKGVSVTDNKYNEEE